MAISNTTANFVIRDEKEVKVFVSAPLSESRSRGLYNVASGTFGQRIFICCAIVVGAMCAVSAFADRLIPCPDCGREVSKRALMCPNCGLKGEVIVAEAARLAKAEEPPPPDDAILADFGDRKERAVPVMFDEKPYAVLPLEKLVGLKTMTLSFVSTNTPIGYASIEVARAIPLVRFGITETNLLFKAEADIAPNQEWQKISPMRLKKDAAKMLEERKQR